jgi:hypothetical protein
MACHQGAHVGPEGDSSGHRPALVLRGPAVLVLSLLDAMRSFLTVLDVPLFNTFLHPVNLLLSELLIVRVYPLPPGICCIEN